MESWFENVAKSAMFWEQTLIIRNSVTVTKISTQQLSFLAAVWLAMPNPHTQLTADWAKNINFLMCFNVCNFRKLKVLQIDIIRNKDARVLRRAHEGSANLLRV